MTEQTTAIVAILHAVGTEQDDDHVGTGRTAAEATTSAKRSMLEAWDELPTSKQAMDELDASIEGGDVLVFVHGEEQLPNHAQAADDAAAFQAEHRARTARGESMQDEHIETLSERMAMAWFFVGSSGDEDSNRLVLRWVRQDDHASIAWLILSDHVLSDDDEAMELVQSILAGGEAG